MKKGRLNLTTTVYIFKRQIVLKYFGKSDGQKQDPDFALYSAPTSIAIFWERSINCVKYFRHRPMQSNIWAGMNLFSRWSPRLFARYAPRKFRAMLTSYLNAVSGVSGAWTVLISNRSSIWTFARLKYWDRVNVEWSSFFVAWYRAKYSLNYVHMWLITQHLISELTTFSKKQNKKVVGRKIECWVMSHAVTRG